jgi:hypothetical protein
MVCSEGCVRRVHRGAERNSSMRPPPWKPPIALSPAEKAIVARIRRAMLFVFRRRRRHTLFSEVCQEELAGIFRASPKGQPPVPPAPSRSCLGFARIACHRSSIKPATSAAAARAASLKTFSSSFTMARSASTARVGAMPTRFAYQSSNLPCTSRMRRSVCGG